MKLIDNLYKIIEQECSSERFVVSLIPESVIYKAHFPNQPITPGACVVQIAHDLIEIKENRRLEILKMSNIKFLATINPTLNQLYDIELRKTILEQNRFKYQVSVSSGNVIYTKMTLICRQK